MSLTLGELFAGYGGLGMAVESVFNARLSWYAEFDDAPSKIMAHHWPGIPNHRDVSKVDWAQVEPVDIISGGSPCQDLSTAGKRRGMTDGTRSNLWVSMREAIATIKPKYVVWENVRGAYTTKADSSMEFCPGCMGGPERAGKHLLRALGRVLGDLSDLGYDAQWRGLPAADVGAPHARYRVFILATRRDVTAHPHGFGSERGNDAPRKMQSRGQDPTPSLANGGTSEPFPAPAYTPSQRGGKSLGGNTDIQGAEIPKSCHWGADSAQFSWGAYEPAIRRWEAIRGPAPAPTELNSRGKHRLSPQFSEWLMGLDGGHVTEVHGLTYAEQLKALGNGVVPQQAGVALIEMLNHKGSN